MSGNNTLGQFLPARAWRRIEALLGRQVRQCCQVQRAARDPLAKLAVPAFLLFGVPSHKDAHGSGADDPDGVVQTALRSLVEDSAFLEASA